MKRGISTGGLGCSVGIFIAVVIIDKRFTCAADKQCKHSPAITRVYGTGFNRFTRAASIWFMSTE